MRFGETRDSGTCSRRSWKIVKACRPVPSAIVVARAMDPAPFTAAASGRPLAAA